MNWLQPKLNLRVAQKQILTPGLVQMVSVLALNRLELREMINQEIMANPVLEEVSEEGTAAESYTDEAFLKKETEKASRNCGSQSVRRIRFWFIFRAIPRHRRRTSLEQANTKRSKSRRSTSFFPLLRASPTT